MGLVLVAVLLGSCFSGMESDRSLLRKFYKNRKAFEQLAQLAIDDESFFLSHSIQDGQGHCKLRIKAKYVDPQRQDALAFCEDMERMGVELIAVNTSSKGRSEVEFDADFAFMKRKGYAYYPRYKPRNYRLFDNLGRVMELGRFYRHIEGDWYLFYNNDD